jgi:hypothetical protein
VFESANATIENGTQSNVMKIGDSREKSIYLLRLS